MYRGFENSRLVLIAVVLLVVSVGQGKDVSLSQVPQAVRATIERETRGLEIEDIDLDNDDGKVVYEVEAENSDGRRCEMDVAEDGSLIKIDAQLRAEDLPAPIAEAVKESVGEVVFFQIRRRLSTNEKLRYDIEADTEDTEIHLQVAGDGSIINENVRLVDRNNIKDQGLLGPSRDVLIKLRHQLKIAAFGDSRGQAGINPRYFGGRQNTEFPMALNFSTSGAGLGRCKTIIEVYLQHAPNLEWVVYATSPRIFNRYYDNWGVGGGGTGYRTDRMGWGVWKQVNTEPVPASAIKGGGDTLLGYEVEDKVGDDEFEDEDDKKDARDSLRRGRYEFDAKRVNAFESMIGTLEKQNVKLLAFTPPIHPVSAGQPCADDDGTTRQAYDELVAKMRAFEKKYSNFYFVDVNNKGRHKIPGTDFDNMDHLNNHGSKTLTLILNDLINDFDSGRKKDSENEQPQQKGGND
ncbi:MAG: PepSY domain-containing protein [Planctomycetota bacterium]